MKISLNIFNKIWLQVRIYSLCESWIWLKLISELFGQQILRKGNTENISIHTTIFLKLYWKGEMLWRWDCSTQRERHSLLNGDSSKGSRQCCSSVSQFCQFHKISSLVQRHLCSMQFWLQCTALYWYNMSLYSISCYQEYFSWIFMWFKIYISFSYLSPFLVFWFIIIIIICKQVWLLVLLFIQIGGGGGE